MFLFFFYFLFQKSYFPTLLGIKFMLSRSGKDVVLKMVNHDSKAENLQISEAVARRCSVKKVNTCSGCF